MHEIAAEGAWPSDQPVDAEAKSNHQEGSSAVSAADAASELRERRHRHVDIPPLIADAPGFEVAMPVEAFIPPDFDSVLATNEASRDFIAGVEEAINYLDAATIQALDEAKLPPLGALKTLTEQRRFVSAVEVPTLDPQNSLLNDKQLMQFLSADKRANLEALSQSPEQLHESLQKLHPERRSETMTHMAFAIPDKSSVGTGTFLGVNNGLSAHAIDAIANKEQRAFWLNALNSGNLTLGFGLTESEVGSDPRGLKTTFKRIESEDGEAYYEISGDKKYIGNAARVLNADGSVHHPGADFIIIFAVDDPGKAPKDRVFQAFMVPRELIGEENIEPCGKSHNKLGLREVNNGDFKLNKVRVPEVCCLGEAGESVYSKLAAMLDITRLYVGAMSAGASSAILSRARGYAERREQGGNPIIDYQMLRFPLEELEGETIATKLLCAAAAREVDSARSTIARNEKIRAELLELFNDYSEEPESSLLRQLGLDELEKQLQSTPASKLHKVKRKLMLTHELLGRYAPKDLESATSLVLRSAELIYKIETPSEFGKLTAMSKLFGSELAGRAAMLGMDTLGGVGYLEDPEQGLGMPKRLRDAKILSIYEGTSNIQRGIIAGELLKSRGKSITGPLSAAATWIRSTPLLAPVRGAARGFLMSREAELDSMLAESESVTLVKYRKALGMIERDWKEKGLPDYVQNWDAGSIEREKHSQASKQLQHRLGLLAELATRCELQKLAKRELMASHTPISETEEDRLVLFHRLNPLRIKALHKELSSFELIRREENYESRPRETKL